MASFSVGLRIDTICTGYGLDASLSDYVISISISNPISNPTYVIHGDWISVGYGRLSIQTKKRRSISNPILSKSIDIRFSDYPIGALILGQEMGHGAFN
jgi:hypothetical protein